MLTLPDDYLWGSFDYLKFFFWLDDLFLSYEFMSIFCVLNWLSDLNQPDLGGKF